MKKKQTPRSRKPARKTPIAPRDPVVVLDVEVSLSTHIHQHVAVPFYTDVPIYDWTRELFIEAARRASVALPRTEPLTMNSAHWADEVLQLGIGAANGDYPFMRMEIVRCPLHVFHRCFGEGVHFVTAIFNQIPVRDAQKNASGVSIAAPGTIRDEYPAHDDDGDLNEPDKKFLARQDRRDRDRLRSIRAARRAAGLPQAGHHERRA